MPFLGICLVERGDVSRHDRDSSHGIFLSNMVEDE